MIQINNFILKCMRACFSLLTKNVPSKIAQIGVFFISVFIYAHIEFCQVNNEALSLYRILCL